MVNLENGFSNLGDREKVYRGSILLVIYSPSLLAPLLDVTIRQAGCWLARPQAPTKLSLRPNTTLVRDIQASSTLVYLCPHGWGHTIGLGGTGATTNIYI